MVKSDIPSHEEGPPAPESPSSSSPAAAAAVAAAAVAGAVDDVHNASTTSESLHGGIDHADSSNADEEEDNESGEENQGDVVMKERKTPGVNVRMTLLPEDFAPSETDVLCGRGRTCKLWKGNVYYRRLVQSKLDVYSAAKGKLAKGHILNQVVDEIRRRSIKGGFVKRDQETGRWYEVGDFLAREKTSQCFRDALHEHYSSSAQAKYKRRKLAESETDIHNREEDSDPMSTGKELHRISSGAVSIQPPIAAPINIGTPQKSKKMKRRPSEVEVGAVLQGMASTSGGQTAASSEASSSLLVRQRSEKGPTEGPRRVLHQQITSLAAHVGHRPSDASRRALAQMASLAALTLPQSPMLAPHPPFSHRDAAVVSTGSTLSSTPLKPRHTIGGILDPRAALQQLASQLTLPFPAPSPPLHVSTTVNPSTAGNSSNTGSGAVAAEVTICALQPSIRNPHESPLDATKNVLDTMDAIAARHQVDLFILPELSPVGYSEDTFSKYLPTSPAVQSMYHQIEYTFASHACKLQAHICYGTIGWKPQEDGSLKFYIRQNVIDRSGQLVASYDKAHLSDQGAIGAETRFFEAGSKEPAVVNIKGVKFGLMLGSDMRDPDLCRALARDEKVDVFLQPAAFPRDISFRTWKSFQETRAVENSVYFIGVNYAGDNYGATAFIPPWVDEGHEPVVLQTAEGYLIGKVQRSVLDHVRTAMPFYKLVTANNKPSYQLKR